MMSRRVYKSYVIIHSFKIMNNKNNEEKNCLVIVIWSDFPFNTVCLPLLEVEQITGLWSEVSDS